MKKQNSALVIGFILCFFSVSYGQTKPVMKKDARVHKQLVVASKENPPQDMKVEKNVKIDELNGQKHLLIETTQNGVTSKEEYFGAEAEAKIKSLEAEENAAPKTGEKKVIEKTIVKENHNE